MTVCVIGETLVDLVWRRDARHIVPLPGGSPANVAVGLRRLQRPVRLVTCWGDDQPGALVERYLSGTGVPVVRAPSASGRTTLAIAHVDDATGGAHYDFLASWDPSDLPVPPEARLLHTGSLAAVVEPGAQRVREACRRMREVPGGVVAVDLNVRPSVQPDRGVYRDSVARLLAVTDVVKASDEDLAWLRPDLPPLESARALLDLGPALVVLTRGPAGATAITAEDEVSVAAPRVDVVDTIGAGDAFQSSLLAALHGAGLPADADALRGLLIRSVTAGALTCTRGGAQPPDREELERALAAPPASSEASGR